jgi:small subunit ribosomal protein S13
MLYFLDKSLPRKKTILQALVIVFGVGLYHVRKSCRFLGLKPNLPWDFLSNKQKTLLLEFLDFEKGVPKGIALKHFVRKKNLDLKLIQNYRGVRLASGLPVRGQRTKTNRKTAKRLNK